MTGILMATASIQSTARKRRAQTVNKKLMIIERTRAIPPAPVTRLSTSNLTGSGIFPSALPYPTGAGRRDGAPRIGPLCPRRRRSAGICLVEIGDDDLLHLHHGLHGAI